jgi:hypothetical protein
MYGPPEYPRASSSPTIILLVSGLAAVLGFLLGFFTGLGAGEPSSSPAPRVTVTVEGSTPAEEPPAQPSASPSAPPATSGPPATEIPSTGAPQTGAPPTGAPQTGAPQTGQLENGTSTDLLGAFGAMRTLVVGVDVQPGTYRTTGPVTGVDKCYWARLNSTDDDVGGVIAAGLPPGPASVTILPTDKGFQTAGCAEWTKV